MHKLKRKFRGGLFWEHQMIWDLFNNTPDQTRDFLYRREDTAGQLPFYYVLSTREPENSVAGLSIQSKLFNPCLQTGDQLRFSLRANAVVTRKVDDHSNKRIRRDIIEARVDDYKQRFPNPADRPSPAVIHQEAAQTWLERQGILHGFGVGEIFADNHSFYNVKKPNDSNTRHFTSLDFHGQLTVTDPELFKITLENGLGRAKAFGCGLLLVRRI
jgi:CRISPR system Cascade subunit CasE